MKDETLIFLESVKFYHRGKRFLSHDSPVLIELRERMESEHAKAKIRIAEAKERRRRPIQLRLF